MILDQVDCALEAWGRWSREGLIHLGYPRQAAMTRIVRSTAPAVLPDYLFEVEKAILKLKPIERKVVVKHYVYWQPVETSAKYCRMSPNRFRAVLNRAKNLISEWISQPFVRTSKPH